jgi:hypothetical protein
MLLSFFCPANVIGKNQRKKTLDGINECCVYLEVKENKKILFVESTALKPHHLPHNL